MESRAESRFVRVSPQKARLVVDLIRGRQAGEALELLAVTRKRIAHEVAKVLRDWLQRKAPAQLEHRP